MLAMEALLASGHRSGKMSYIRLQSWMEKDPGSHESEATLVYSQFKSAVQLFQQKVALNFIFPGVRSDPNLVKDLGDNVILLAQVTPLYPKLLVDYPKELINFLRSSARILPSSLRASITNALIHLIKLKIVAIKETLALFMELQVLHDKYLKERAFLHVIHSISRMNEKHKNEKENRALQSILFSIIEQEKNENKAMRSLATICHLYRKKVWCDDRTSNAICRACFHSSSRIMIAALSFLLGYEKIEQDIGCDEEEEEDAIE